MAERSNAHDSKSCDAGMYPRVQIPFSAPKANDTNLGEMSGFVCFCAREYFGIRVPLS